MVLIEETHVEQVLEFGEEENYDLFVAFLSYVLSKESHKVNDLDIAALNVRPENTPHIAPIDSVQTTAFPDKLSKEFHFFFSHKNFAISAIVSVD